MSNPVRVTKTLAAASANNIATSQTPSGAGNLNLNGSTATNGVATLDTQRRVLFTFAGADAARTFTVYGANDSGQPIVEVVAGANNPATSSTTLDFKTVTRIAVDAATAGALTVGTSGVGATQWFNFDYQMHPVPFSLAVGVSGTVNYTVQWTYDEIRGPYGIRAANAPTPVPTSWNDPILVATATAGETTMDHPVTGWRIVVNSGTGSIAATGIQAGLQG